MQTKSFHLHLILLLLLFSWSTPYLSAAETILTPEEQSWIAEHPVINVRVSKSYPPFEFYENGEYQGLAYDYLMLIAERAGITFQTVPEMSWADALKSIANKDGVDLILLITRTAERETLMNFTRDYIIFPEVIITRERGHFVSGLEDLRGRLVATENDFVEADILRRDVPDVKLLETETTAEALRAVAAGKADAYVGDLAVGSYLIDELGLTNLQIAAPAPYGDDSYAMAARKDWPELINILEKGMSSLSPSDHQSVKEKWFVIPYKYGLDVIDIIKWVAFVALVALVFIIQLKRMVKSRTRELRANQKLLQVTQDNAFQFVGLLTPEGILCDTNRSSLEFIGAKKEEVTGKLFWETPWWGYSAEEQEKLKEAVHQAAQGKTVSYETTFPSKKGDMHIFAFSLKPVRNDDGTIIYIVPSGHDITELKKLQTKAFRTSQLASLGELAAGVAHEVNNPITGVINYAQLLVNRGTDNDQSKHILEKIIKEANRVASIVKGLLTFAREDSINFELLDLRDLLDETLALNGRQLIKDSINLHHERVNNLPRVRGNAQQLVQLFLNMISNARYALNEKYPEHSNKKELRIAIERVSIKAGDFVRVTIFDNGGGIPAEKRDQIMQPFITTKPVGQGTGLGLSICTNITNNHGGTISFESKYGHYTKFIIDFPAVADNQESGTQTS